MEMGAVTAPQDGRTGMTMQALKTTEAVWDWPEAELADRSEAALLNHIRFVALGCRAKARTDLFQACALLHSSGTQSFRLHAEALMQCLNEALGKQAVLFRPGTAERSFDENWLLRLMTALSNGDEASASFLLHSRIDREKHRLMRYLLSRVSAPFALS